MEELNFIVILGVNNLDAVEDLDVNVGTSVFFVDVTVPVGGKFEIGFDHPDDIGFPFSSKACSR